MEDTDILVAIAKTPRSNNRLKLQTVTRSRKKIPKRNGFKMEA